ncbi:transporter [Amylibacter marinus]|uniref:Transporter n=1 Tax=Amylibacter marinus TaxID=1475483 RepID=A0ABQ5VVD3_9RHOB|nr:AEC family transporter [Amylibacter marinus]GLQ35208.1 transporter [Amylibacter marinus]
MFSIALLIAPIFGLMVLGLVLRRGIFESGTFWGTADKLVYWVLMPSLLFYKTSTTSFDMNLVVGMGMALLGAFFCAAVFGVIAGRLIGLNGASISSVLQGSARHNTFLALAVAESLFGTEGLAIAALGSAMLIPVTNLTVVPLIITLTPKRRTGGLITAILADLARNPLLVSIFLGVSCNLVIGQQIPVVHEMTRLLGGATLPLVLLVVSASLRGFEGPIKVSAVVTAGIGKFILFPLLAFGIARGVGLSDMQTIIAVIFAAAPSASSSYTLARQLGGDAPLSASIVAIHTGLAFVTLPITVALAQYVLGH